MASLVKQISDFIDGTHPFYSSTDPRAGPIGFDSRSQTASSSSASPASPQTW